MKTKQSKRNFLIGMALAGTVGLGSIAVAGPHCKKFGGGKHGAYRDNPEFMQKRLDRMSEKLSLTDTQKQQVQTLMENHKNTMKPLRDEKRNLRTEMKALDPSASDYTAKLADIANRKAELVRQIMVERGNKRQKMSQILTEEQRALKKKCVRSVMAQNVSKNVVKLFSY